MSDNAKIDKFNSTLNNFTSINNTTNKNLTIVEDKNSNNVTNNKTNTIYKSAAYQYKSNVLYKIIIIVIVLVIVLAIVILIFVFKYKNTK